MVARWGVALDIAMTSDFDNAKAGRPHAQPSQDNYSDRAARRRQVPIDHAPREYSNTVALLRRSVGGPLAPQRHSETQTVHDWLVGDALAENDLLALFEALNWRLVAAGLPLDRASLHVGTLHPQLFGFSWNWQRDDGICDEIHVPAITLTTDAYRKTPIHDVVEFGQQLSLDLRAADVLERYPLMATLAGQGYTQYLARPLNAGQVFHNAATVATRAPNGFSESELLNLDRALRVFALHVARHSALRISQNVAQTYLGEAAGQRVLDGSIQRGQGEAVKAVIWVSDMRGFTDLADRLSARNMTLVLNAYFDVMASAVLDHGGEILKFMGDGLLSVFALDEFGGVRPAAAAAVMAAQRALLDLDDLNANENALPSAVRWQPLQTGIALHLGDVFFGNVGAPDRLDFTVIGSAVNAASRVEALSKPLGRSLLITAPVAAHLDLPLEPLGEQDLRGVSQPLAIYGLVN